MKVNPPISKVIFWASFWGCFIPALGMTGLFLIMDIIQLLFIALPKVDYNFKNAFDVITKFPRHNINYLLMMRLESGYAISLFLTFQIFRNAMHGFGYRTNVITMFVYVSYCLLYYFLFKNAQGSFLYRHPELKWLFVGLCITFALYVVLSPFKNRINAFFRKLEFPKCFKKIFLKIKYDLCNYNDLKRVFITGLVLMLFLPLLAIFIVALILPFAPIKNSPKTIMESVSYVFNSVVIYFILFTPPFYTVSWILNYKKIKEIQRYQKSKNNFFKSS